MKNRTTIAAVATNNGNCNGNGSLKGHPQPAIDPPPAGKRHPHLERALDTLPLLREISRPDEWTSGKLLNGLRGQFLLHFYSNAVGFLQGAIGLGLDPTRSTVFYKTGGYRYIEKRKIIEHLRWMGFTVRPAEDITPDYAAELDDLAARTHSRIFWVEDGGKVGPIYAANPGLAERVAFIVEQTSRGERLTRSAKQKIKRPVLSIARSRLKKPEAFYVADGGVSALKALIPHDSIKLLKPAVLGLSDIGRAVMLSLAENCAPAKGFDVDPERRHDALPLCGHIVDFAIDAIRDADVIFGCSGFQSIGVELLPHLKSGVKLIPMSSEDVEFDKPALAQMGVPSPIYRAGRPRTEANRMGTRYTLHGSGKIIDLIADGYPIGFFAADFGGVGDRQIDMTMSLLFMSMMAGASGRYARRRGLVDGEVDRLAAKHRLAERFLRYHR